MIWLRYPDGKIHYVIEEWSICGIRPAWDWYLASEKHPEEQRCKKCRVMVAKSAYLKERRVKP